MPRPSVWSLRSRLLLLAVALVALGLAVSDTVVVRVVEGQLVQRADQQLARYGGQLAGRVGATRDRTPPVRPPGGTAHGVDPGRDWVPSQFAVAFAYADGSVSDQAWVRLSDTDPRPLWPHLDAAALRARYGHPFDTRSDHGGERWRVLVVPVRERAGRGGTGSGGGTGGGSDGGGGTGGSDGGGTGGGGTGGSGGLTANAHPVAGAAPAAAAHGQPVAVVVASSLDEVSSTGAKLRTAFWLIGGAVVAALALAGWFAVRAGLRPLRRIEATATEIAAGRPLSHRMPAVSPRTEAGRLSSALNSMLAQIESAFAARADSEDRMRRFVADASHELRTPLAGIRGFAELYRMGALSDDADVKRVMARIESEAVRLGGLVEDLLTLARMDEQRPPELVPMDLRSLAADALHDTTALDPAREVALTGPGGPPAPPGPALVLGDEARLRQVIANLVGNAVRHTPPGTPIRIGVGTVDGHGVIEVADHGPGLAPDQAARVFERFYRVDASRSRHEGGGAGLGLAIVTALVSAQHGTVTLDTAPGHGATFRVSLPQAPPQPADADPA
jgi:two-component system OmpR family sensor kinase